MIIQKKSIILLIFLLIRMLAYSQNDCAISISGVVLSEEGNALAGASIEIFSLKLGTVADDQGKFVFKGLCPGNYDVIIQYVGFVSKKVAINLKGDVVRRVELEQDITQLNEVVIRDKPASTENAQNFSILNEKQLRETSGKALGEVLKEIPGVNAIQSGPGIFKPVIHGLHSQRILILNYGIRQEGQQWGAEHAPEIDPFVASNVVVIKDASAIKYGTDALGGVIVVNPPPLPEEEGIGGSANTVLQSNGRSGTISGLLEGGLKNHRGWGWRMQGTLKRTGDFHAPDYMLTNTGAKENNFSLAAGYHDEHKGLDIFFSRFQTELGVLKGTSVSNLDDLVNAMEREPPQYTSDFSYRIGEPRQEVSHNLLKINGHIQTSKGEV
ncbi:MAG: TonB-dependent receptor, partial [Marivirga sp.]|nr:TonB-dependent receptor [Marivirga sp.]